MGLEEIHAHADRKLQAPSLYGLAARGQRPHDRRSLPCATATTTGIGAQRRLASGSALPTRIERADRAIPENPLVGGHQHQIVDPRRGREEPIGRILAESPRQPVGLDGRLVVGRKAAAPEGVERGFHPRVQAAPASLKRSRDLVKSTRPASTTARFSVIARRGVIR